MRRQVPTVEHLFCLVVSPENKPPETQNPDRTVDSLPTLRKIHLTGASVADFDYSPSAVGHFLREQLR